VIRLMPLNNKPYGLILVDRKTRFKIVRLLKSKDEIIIKVKVTIKEINNTFKRYPVHLYYDGGKEISRLRPYLREKGIVFSESSPYAHNQNGLAKRAIRVVLERLRVIMVALGLLSSLWGYVIGPVVKLVNRTTNTTKELTLYQFFFDKLVPLQAPHIPDLSNYRAIGANCMVLVPPEKRIQSQKLAPRGVQGRLLAVLGTQTYLVWLG